MAITWKKVAFAADIVSDTAYDATTWDGVTTVAPSKNAVRDQRELDAVSMHRKNAIINGNFDIWQRGTSFIPTTNLAFPVDRFATHFSGAGVVSALRSTNIPTQLQSGYQSSYSFFLQVTTADDSVDASDYWIYQQKIEGYTYAGLRGKTCTLSFWVKAIKTGTYCVAFRNNGSDRSYIAEYTINTTDTWEKKTITLTFNQAGGTENYLNGTGINISFVIMCGSTYGGQIANSWISANKLATSNQVNGLDSTSNVFRFAQIQLEVGSVATQFECRPIAEELILCQRYFERLGIMIYGGFANANQRTTTEARGTIFYKPKRAAPALAHSGSISATGASGSNAITAVNILYPNTDRATTTFISTNTNITAGEGVVIGFGNDIAAYIDISAEL